LEKKLIDLEGLDEDSLSFINDALKVIELANENGIILRIMGAIAIRLHSPKFRHLYKSMERPLTDIDFMTYSKSLHLLKKFFLGLGFIPNESIIRTYWDKRHIYYDKKGRTIDVFIDKLEMCHTINFKGRLELDYPTITLSDLLLSKIQIVQINEKDVKDVIVMLLEHDVGESEYDVINKSYIARILSDDWGFYYTATTNLRKIRNFLDKYSIITNEDREDLSAKISKLLIAIENQPKSIRWKMRAKIGTSKKWYTDVGEVLRPGLADMAEEWKKKISRD